MPFDSEKSKTHQSISWLARHKQKCARDIQLPRRCRCYLIQCMPCQQDPNSFSATHFCATRSASRQMLNTKVNLTSPFQQKRIGLHLASNRNRNRKTGFALSLLAISIGFPTCFIGRSRSFSVDFLWIANGCGSMSLVCFRLQCEAS